MRKILTILTLIFLFLTIFFVLKLVQFKPIKSPEILQQTPLIPAETTQDKVAKNEVNVELIKQESIFMKSRGKMDSEEAKFSSIAPESLPQFTLIGVCRMDDVQVAIIEYPQINNKSAKQYFKLGEEVRDGYSVANITMTAATLKKGSKNIELEVGRPRLTSEDKLFDISFGKGEEK